MIYGTMTLRYLFRIVLSGAVAKGEDFITSGSVTRQGGNSSVTGGVVYPISFSSFGLPFAITFGEVLSANIIIYAGSNNVSGFEWGSSVGNSSTSILWTSIGI